MSPLILLFLLFWRSGKVQSQALPKCWRHQGECLDKNQPPLNLEDRVKPDDNENIVGVFPNVLTLDQCLSKCETEAECKYFTLYRPDPDKDCLLVGFNLKTSCQRLSNVCVLHKECGEFNRTCVMGCTTGRRLIHDVSTEATTIIIGGVKEKRLKLDEYHDSIEILDDEGETPCPVKTEKTQSREGAAGGFCRGCGGKDIVVLCGGWQTGNIYASDIKAGVFDGQYEASCEGVEKGGNWDNSLGFSLRQPRAFFSIAETPGALYAFGGYNDEEGMLAEIERFDGTEWTVVDNVTLRQRKSHTCAVSFPLSGTQYIFVLGGWNNNLNYVNDIDVFFIDPGNGGLKRNNTFGNNILGEKPFVLPSDRMDDDPVFQAKADLGCMYYRREGWRDGIILTGGYRSAGAWLNSAWFLDISRVLDPTNNPGPWAERLTDISPQFDKGRHFHQMTTAKLQPMVVGGWRNMPEISTMVFDDCIEDDDITRKGVWTEYKYKKLRAGREKFVAISVPKEFLKSSDINCI